MPLLLPVTLKTSAVGRVRDGKAISVHCDLAGKKTRHLGSDGCCAASRLFKGSKTSRDSKMTSYRFENLPDRLMAFRRALVSKTSLQVFGFPIPRTKVSSGHNLDIRKAADSRIFLQSSAASLSWHEMEQGLI